MPLSVLKEGTTDVPALFGLQQMQLQNLKPDSTLTNEFFKVTLDHDWGVKWVGTTPRRKVILSERGPLEDQKINAYIVGQLAKDFSSASVGDYVFLSNVTVQKSATFGGRDMVHPCQLVLATENRPDIWVVPNKGQASTSSGTTNTNDRIKGGRVTNDVTPAAPDSDHQSVLFKELYNYQYTPLKDMKATRKVDVYGVVKFFKPPYKCAGPDYCMVITIVDPSIDPEVSGFKCLIFNADLEAMPKVRDIGDIIRFHRLKVVTYNDDLQGQKGPGFSCLVFDGAPDAPIEPRSTSANYTLSELDKTKVKELRDWGRNSGISSERSKFELSKVTADVQHFDLVCQVIVVACQPQDSCVYLKVWDGTRCKLSLAPPIDVYQLDDSARAEVERVDRLAVDVCVNGQHVQFAKALQPGDFIRFYNLSVVSEGSSSMFVLQEGTSYGRGLVVLSQTDDIVRKLMRKLDTAVEDDLLAEDDSDEQTSTPAATSVATPHQQQGRNQVQSLVLLDDPSVVTLSKVRSNQYFDLTCQVIKVVEIPETSCVCINVWDGTKMTVPCREIDYSNLSVSVIPGLVTSAGSKAVDVCLYDNHIQKGRQIKAGDFIRVTNLHAARYPPVPRGALVPKGTGPQMVELALHQGTSYGKGLEILPADDPLVVALKRRFDVLLGKAPPATLTTISNDDPNNEQDTEPGEQAAPGLPTPTRRRSKKGRGVGSPAKELRCMQQFASFTTDCEQVKYITVSEAESISLPNRFRLRARVSGYTPDDVRDFVHLHCARCNHRCSLRFLNHKEKSNSQNGGNSLHEPPSPSDNRHSPRLRERLLRNNTEVPVGRTGLRSRIRTDTGNSDPGKVEETTVGRTRGAVRYEEADSSQESNSSKALKRNLVEEREATDPLQGRLRSSTREASRKKRRKEEEEDDDGEADEMDSQASNDYYTASDGGSSQGSHTSSPVFHQRLKLSEVNGKYGTLTAENLSAADVINLCRNGLKLARPPKACLKYVPMSSEESGIHFLCPICCPSRKKGSKVLMEFEYHFKLTLADDTGDLQVIVHGEHAEKFLCEIEAGNLYKDISRRNDLTKIMRILCKNGEADASPSKKRQNQLECCIKGETRVTGGREERVYHLVNTRLSNDMIDG